MDYNLDQAIGLASDRLSATWLLDSARVRALSSGSAVAIDAEPAARVAIPTEWTTLVKQDPQRARDEQVRVRAEFHKAFDQQLICAGFERGDLHSSYLLFEPQKLTGFTGFTR
jgi:predicted GNAT superfamily acetyltransferase